MLHHRPSTVPVWPLMSISRAFTGHFISCRWSRTRSCRTDGIGKGALAGDRPFTETDTSVYVIPAIILNTSLSAFILIPIMVTVGIVKVDVALNLTLMTRDLGVVTLAWRAMHARAGGLAEVADKRVKACDLLRQASVPAAIRCRFHRRRPCRCAPDLRRT